VEQVTHLNETFVEMARRAVRRGGATILAHAMVERFSRKRVGRKRQTPARVLTTPFRSTYNVR
jgi:hypothetical protein